MPVAGEKLSAVQYRRYVVPDMPLWRTARAKLNIAAISLVSFVAERFTNSLTFFASNKYFHYFTSIFDRLYGSERSLRFLTAPFDRGFGLRCRPSTWRGCIFRRPFGHFLVVFRSQSLAVVIFAHRVFIWAGGYPPPTPPNYKKHYGASALPTALSANADAPFCVSFFFLLKRVLPPSGVGSLFRRWRSPTAPRRSRSGQVGQTQLHLRRFLFRFGFRFFESFLHGCVIRCFNCLVQLIAHYAFNLAFTKL